MDDNEFAYLMEEVWMAGIWPVQASFYLLNMINHCDQKEKWGIGGSRIFVNYAVWESVVRYKNVVDKVINPNDRMSGYPPSTVASPHLFKKVAVAGICVD